MSTPEREDGRVEFSEPASLTDAEVRRRHLAEKIGDIATQLADRDRRHADGKRFTDKEYHDWRRRALGAMRAHERVLRQVNDWIKHERRRQHAEKSMPPEQLDAFRIIDRAYKLFVKLREEEVEFTAEEWADIELLRNYLDRPKPATEAAT